MTILHCYTDTSICKHHFTAEAGRCGVTFNLYAVMELSLGSQHRGLPQRVTKCNGGVMKLLIGEEGRKKSVTQVFLFCFLL